MSYTIEITDYACDELQTIKAFYRRQILEAIDLQLVHEPTTETKNRKVLVGLQPHFEHSVPLWELRVGQYRVYYNVDEHARTVLIRAIRQIPPHATTEETL